MKQTKIGSVLWLVLAALVAGVFATPAQAQQAGDRYTILVPYLAPQNGADDNFGEDVAKELRKLIDNLHTHQTVSDDELKRARRKYDLDEEQLYNCITARQLAMRENWQLVLCGEYQPAGGSQVNVNASFVGSESAETFEVPAFSAQQRQPKQAAQQILQSFDQWQTQLRYTVFCQQYIDSQQWDQALNTCDQALAINPTSQSALYQKAYALWQTERRDEALATVNELLELDPIDQSALKLAGIISTEQGNREQAMTYLNRYMELNPGDVQVRLTIATDIANAGDYQAAVELARAGLETEPDNLQLVTYIGHFAANAAAAAESAMANGQGANVDPTKVTEFYQTAAEMYERVFNEQGTETDPTILEKLIISLFKLDRMDEAVTLGERATQAQPENAAIWEAYSRALEAAGQPAEALAAIERVQSLGGGSPALVQRRAMIQLGQGRTEAGVQALNEAVEAGTLERSAAFRIIFAHAYQDNFQKGRLDAAYALLDAAGPLAVSDEDKLTRNFWRGYILYQQAQAVGEPMDAAAAAKAKPMFERALELFQASRGYERIHSSADVPKLIDATQRFIEIQEALIKRGR